MWNPNKAMIARVARTYEKKEAFNKVSLRLRQLQHFLSAGKQFGVLSAYGPKSKSENQARNGILIGELQKRGYNFHPLKGSWEGTAEKSVFVPNMAFTDLVELGRMFAQDSVIYKDPSGVVGMYYLKEGKVTFAADEKASIAVEMAVGDTLYSKARGISFEFGFMWGQHQPWNGTTPYTMRGLTRALEQEV